MATPVPFVPYTFKQINGREWTDSYYKSRKGISQYKIDYAALVAANADKRVRYAEYKNALTSATDTKLRDVVEKAKEVQASAEPKCSAFDIKCHIATFNSFLGGLALNVAFGVGAGLVAYFLYRKYSK